MIDLIPYYNFKYKLLVELSNGKEVFILPFNEQGGFTDFKKRFLVCVDAKPVKDIVRVPFTLPQSMRLMTEPVSSSIPESVAYEVKEIPLYSLRCVTEFSAELAHEIRCEAFYGIDTNSKIAKMLYQQAESALMAKIRENADWEQEEIKLIQETWIIDDGILSAEILQNDWESYFD